MIRIEKTYINSTQLPVVWQVTAGNDASIDHICAWFCDQKSHVDRILDQDGALLLRGFRNIDSAEHFDRILSVVAPQLMDYVGGTSPRKVVHGKIMTATELPSSYSIPLHQEMSYTNNSPDRVAFFCLIPSLDGGHTNVGDMRKITQCIDSDVRERFIEKKGVQLRRTLPSIDAVDKKPGVPKPWTEVFNTTDRAEVQRVSEQRGWNVLWLKDDSVQLWQEIRAVTKVHERTGDEVWFNQVHIFSPAASLKWARQDKRDEQVARLEEARREHPEMLDQVFHGDGTVVDDDDALHVYDAFDHSAIPVCWQRGDILFLDNVLTAHGRTAFRGNRMVLAALIRGRAEQGGSQSRKQEVAYVD